MAKLGKYALFMGDRYYPSGGFEDYVHSSDSLDFVHNERNRRKTKYTYCWWQIVNTETGEIIAKGEYDE